MKRTLKFSLCFLMLFGSIGTSLLVNAQESLPPGEDDPCWDTKLPENLRGWDSIRKECFANREAQPCWIGCDNGDIKD